MAKPTLQTENENLKKELTALRQEHSIALEQLSFNPSEFDEQMHEPVTLRDTRKEMLLAVAHKIDLNFPQASAQRLSHAVDVAMKEWGIE